MAEKRIEWLNQNRYRAYPFVNDAGLVCQGSRIPDGILLDCLVVDLRTIDHVPELVVTCIDVSSDSVRVHYVYDGRTGFIRIPADGPSSCSSSPDWSSSSSSNSSSSPSDDTMEDIHGCVRYDAFPFDLVQITFVFARPSDVFDTTGECSLPMAGRILPTRIVSVPAAGVASIRANGSGSQATSSSAVGDIHLRDGCRTRPVVRNGKVTVSVGTGFGEDPCHSEDASAAVSCRDSLFFFCGQNAIDTGDVVLSGGPGVNVSEGRYTLRSDAVDAFGRVCATAGETLPCIDVQATSELLAIYTPSVEASESSSS